MALDFISSDIVFRILLSMVKADLSTRLNSEVELQAMIYDIGEAVPTNSESV
jgi:hypothetical protein